ncbi:MULTISPECIES: L-fucose mutarotase [Clostridia]|uniref:L-fucose mutarotase n=1 Tax=Clostridia TaxID=186801 RepID=UPI000EA0283A|nr:MULTISPECIES: L-fucose mutarotase [Clostridia]NBJ70814.1 L-fucose mutarotase [Roseburia sp. 1XD42-34]RKI75783.1 L-fucose mutarotase [Clostridium sp. 1xD42-85]
MLKKIPSILSPNLVKILMEMGHGDELVISDANFPAERVGQRVVRADGHTVPELLKAILELFPLDKYSNYQYALMEVVEGDDVEPVIWNAYSEVIEREHPNAQVKYMGRFDFYKQAQGAFAVLITGETALYGNVIIKKGVI